MERISVIVPVYNVERYLERCVASIQNQTYRDLEIILVDDGSPDRCPELCEELKQKDPRIKVVHKENGGLGYARNSGLEVATGAYVTFVDSDDWISRTHIANLYEAAEKYGADAAIGAHTNVSAEGEQVVRPSQLPEKLYEGQAITDEILLPLIGPDVGIVRDVQLESSCCMNLYRMDLIRAHGLRFVSERDVVSEDMFFNIDFFCVSDRVAVTKEVGYFYCWNQESISRKYDPKRVDRTHKFYAELKRVLRDRGLAERAGCRVERAYLMNIRFAIRHIVRSDLPRKEKLRQIRGVLESDITQKALDAYPIQTFVPAMRLWAELMRRKKVLGVYYLIKLREAAKGQKAMRAILKRIGIGR